MEIAIGIIIGLVGIAAGGIITHIYARRASDEQSRSFAELMRKLEQQNEHLLATLRDAQSHVAESDPGYAKELEDRLAEVKQDKPDETFQMPIWTDDDRCPKCKEGHLKWSRWGRGPYGSSNAWFRCNNCGQEFPGYESLGN
jgi:uncharacterized protein with PIN domain